MKMMVPSQVFEKYRRAGEIAAKVRNEMKEFASEGMLVIEICERAEEMIRKMGGKPAFPCNVSVNEVAAHYSSPPKDTTQIPENSLVKIDVGVHVDGYIADTATTVCFNSEYDDLVSAAERALERAVQIVRPGLSMSKFGSEVERVIRNYGFRPVSNLTGHQVGRYLIHAGKALPNVSHLSTAKIQPGEAYAVEPFVTLANGAGRVDAGDEAHIFRFLKHKSLKNARTKDLLKYIEENFRSLPFSERWLRDFMCREWYVKAFSELLSSKSLTSYPVFVEASRKPVAQAEHTVLVREKNSVVLT